MTRIVLFFLVILLYNIYSTQKKSEEKRRKGFLLFTGLFFVLESALRNLGVGSDTYHYYELFEYTKQSSWDNIFDGFTDKGEFSKDTFYYVFQKSFQHVFPKFRLFLFFIAILFFSSFNWFLKKSGLTLREMMIAYLFYLGMFHHFFSYTGLRQTIAVSFIFYACVFLLEKRYVVSLIFASISFLFHSSAIIFILAYFLKFVKGSTLMLPLMGIVLLIDYFQGEQLVTIILNNGGFEERYGIYLEVKEGAGSYPIVAMYIMLIIGILLSHKRIVQDEKLLMFFKMYCVVVACLPLLFIDNTAFRITLYFSISMYILVPNLVSGLKHQNKYLIVYTLFLILMLFSALKTNYRFYWQPMDLPVREMYSFREPLL